MIQLETITPAEQCRHPKINFGSGDYYLFCHACGARWVRTCAHADHPPRPDLANRGVGSQLSGEARVVPTVDRP